MKRAARQLKASGQRSAQRRGERGFSIIQLLITLTIISLVLTFALVNVTRAREHMRLVGSARVFASYVEKARLDAIRRHGGGTPASIQFTDSSHYNVTMDFAGTNNPTTRNISFDPGVRLQSLPPAAMTFDWRGRLALCTQTFLMINGSSDTTVIDVSGSGDVTIDGDPGDIPTINHSTVASGDTLSDAVVRGTNAPAASTIGDCSGASSGPPPPPIGTTGCGGSPSASPSLVTIRKNGGSSATIVITVPAIATVTAAPPSNLYVTPASKFVTGSANFTVVSNNNWRSTFPITFNAPCFATPLTVQVKVVN